MKVTTKKTIKKAIDDCDLSALEKISCAQLKTFEIDGLNALVYACYYATPEIIGLIIQRMDKYFQDYMKDFEEGDDGCDKIEELMDDDFGDFFYPSTFSDSNNIEYNMATIAMLRGDRSTQKLLRDVAGLRPIELPTESSAEILEYCHDVTKKYGSGYSGQGYFGKAFEIKKRNPRGGSTFSSERERQLLKQLSTLLFFNIPRTDARKLKEIEAMHVCYGDKNYIFVAGNEAPATAAFKEEFSDSIELKDKLKTVPKVVGDKEGKKRADRYALNFLNNILEDGSDSDSSDNSENEREQSGGEYYQRIKNLLRAERSLYHLDIKYIKPNRRGWKLDKESEVKVGKILDDDSAIIFINTSKLPKRFEARHAEEFLTDIAEAIKDIADKKKISFYASIAGKKRPCVTCHSRMESSNVINSYGNRPGLMWFSALEKQDEVAKETSMESLIKKTMYVTIDSFGKENPAYDTGTGSESDSDSALDSDSASSNSGSMRDRSDSDGTSSDSSETKSQSASNSSSDSDGASSDDSDASRGESCGSMSNDESKAESESASDSASGDDDETRSKLDLDSSFTHVNDVKEFISQIPATMQLFEKQGLFGDVLRQVTNKKGVSGSVGVSMQGKLK